MIGIGSSMSEDSSSSESYSFGSGLGTFNQPGKITTKLADSPIGVKTPWDTSSYYWHTSTGSDVSATSETEEKMSKTDDVLYIVDNTKEELLEDIVDDLENCETTYDYLKVLVRYKNKLKRLKGIQDDEG